jgi:hypothetical protein
MIRADSSLIDGAFAVCTALDAAGITAVLCGGSAATYYAPEAYMSADADFVMRVDIPLAEVSLILAPLGFRREGRIFVHDLATKWSVDFPPGPLAIGRDFITDWVTVRRDGEILHVISALDAVRDRFMHYLAWNDYSGLTTAVSVARAQSGGVDLDALRTWTDLELKETPVYERKRVEALFKALGAGS